MAAADPVLESLERLQSMMESFDESLSQLCKDNSSESTLDLRKNLMEYYRDLYKALKSKYETLKISDKKPEEPGTSGKNKENKISKVTGSSPVSPSFSKVLSSVKVRPAIKTLCDKADGSGLRNYVINNRKNVEILRNELTVALSKAPDAGKLVLKALEGYDFSKSGSTRRERMESLCSANRKACILLMESLFPVFGNDDCGAVPSDVKDSARELAKVWRKEMKIEKDADSACALDVQAFLQLLASFRIAADYEKDDILGLVFAISRRKQTTELCRSLGLSSKVPDLMDKLSKSSCRQITALRFAHAFGIMDKVDAVELLKSYLRDVEKDAKELLTNGHDSAASQDHLNLKKLTALKSVINVVKVCGLQNQFFEDDLQKNLTKLVQENKDFKRKRRKHAKKKKQEREDGKKVAERRKQHKRQQSFKPGYGSSRRAKHSSPNNTAGGMGDSKASPYNIDEVQNKFGIIGHDHHTSAFSAANRSSTGLAAGSFTSAPSIAAQINDERRCHPSGFGTSNLTPIGSSLYGSSVPTGVFATPLSNVAAVEHEGRGQQSYTTNFGEIDKNHLRASVCGTGDLAKSAATQSNYNYEGRGPEQYTSAFVVGNMGSIGSSIYGSNSHTTPTDVNQGGHQRSLGQYSGFAGGNMVPIESSGYGPGASTVPPSNVTQGHFESRGSVIDKYLFNSGLTSLPRAY